jgi:hypothetical protein
MERKSTTALLLAAMMVGGLAYASAGQRAFAHNFSGDESAAFLANVDAIKVQLMLVGGNYAGNPDSAKMHADHASEHLGAADIKEITEKNQRLGTDLPAALEKLKTSVAGKSPRSDIVQQIKDINGMLDETVTVRIDNSQLSNSTVSALVFANLVNEILESYQGAYGMSDEDNNSGSMNMTDSSMNHTSSTAMASDKIVNMASYQSANWLALKASSMYYKLNLVAPSGSDASMTKLRAGLDELKSAIGSQASLDAFGLKLAEESDGHDHGSGEMSGMSGNMTGGNMTGGSMEGNMTQ